MVLLILIYESPAKWFRKKFRFLSAAAEIRLLVASRALHPTVRKELEKFHPWCKLADSIV